MLAAHFFLAGAWPSSAAVTVTGEAPSAESAAGAACSTVKGPVTLAASVRSARTASMASAYSGRSAATASVTERIGVFWLVLASDFTQMARAGVEHLAGLGHCRIVALLRETASDDAHARQDQARELLRAAQELGVEVLVRQVPEAALAGAGIVGADGLIEGCSAVLSNNPAAVVGLSCAAQAHGLSVPADLSVLTLGITQDSGRQGEAFSELSVDREAMGAEAGSLLLRCLSGEPDPAQRRRLMPALLTDRGTTARCRS